jgi:rifampin ADP-ribosylating transferase
MDFSASNHVVNLCLQGMNREETGRPEEAASLFLQAWQQATDDFEKYLSAYYVARQLKNASGKVQWLHTAVEFASRVDDYAVKSAFSAIYQAIAQCYQDLQDDAQAKAYADLAISCQSVIADSGPFYHGTKADLQTGDLLIAGGHSNYIAGIKMNHIYFTASLNGAGLAAELAKGNGEPSVYVIEPTGNFENDPNVTNQKFPGNPTRSYRSKDPLKIVGKITDWARLPAQELQAWKERLAKSSGEIIN